MADDSTLPPASPPPLPFAAHTQAMMDKIRRTGFPPLSQQPVDMARKAYASSVGAMAHPAVPLPRVEHFTIPGPAGDIPARLWASTHDHDLPVFLYLHGGGFVVGSIDTCAAMCSQIAQQSGAAVVAIDYRLAPEHKYPASLEDGMAALRWLVEHGHTRHLDASRLAVGGDSAGGTLAAILAVLARDAGIPLKLQALFYPSVQVGVRTDSFNTYARATFLNGELMRWFETHARGGPLSERWHREPLHAPDHTGVAPAWIGLAQCDPLTDEGHLYAEKLRAAGVPVELRVWPGVIHDFINMGRFLPEAAQAHTALAEALKQAFSA